MCDITSNEIQIFVFKLCIKMAIFAGSEPTFTVLHVGNGLMTYVFH